MKRYLPFAIIAIVLCSAIAVATYMLRSPRQSTSNTSTSTSTAKTGGAQPSGADPPRSRGEANAPVTIEEFGDMQCPPCAALHPEMKRIEAEYGPRVRVIFRHFPLTQMHPFAVEAAQAAEAAGEQGKFWEMHDWLYEHQLEWSKHTNPRQLFAAAAQSMGINVERFREDMNSAEVKQRVIQDYRRGVSLGVTGTPTLFINGRQVTQENMTDTGIRGMINSELAAKGK